MVFLYITIKIKSEKIEHSCLTSSITRINSVIHKIQWTYIRVNQSQTELYCQFKTHPHHTLQQKCWCLLDSVIISYLFYDRVIQISKESSRNLDQSNLQRLLFVQIGACNSCSVKNQSLNAFTINSSRNQQRFLHILCIPIFP